LSQNPIFSVIGQRSMKNIEELTKDFFSLYWFLGILLVNSIIIDFFSYVGSFFLSICYIHLVICTLLDWFLRLYKFQTFSDKIAFKAYKFPFLPLLFWHINNIIRRYYDLDMCFIIDLSF
jgi:hypothetical protein